MAEGGRSQQPRDPVVDVLAAVVGMEPEDREGELREHLLEHRRQVGLGDPAKHASRGPPGQRTHGAINLGQQRHIGPRVAPARKDTRVRCTP